VKYWDTPIIIVERERFWETAGVYFLSNIISLLGQRETAFSSFLLPRKLAWELSALELQLILVPRLPITAPFMTM